MELTGDVLMNAPRDRVWAALNDPAVLQACIPGCEEVIDDSPTERRVRVMIKVGPVRARFQGKVTLSDVEAPERCVLSFEGSGGAAGMASGRSQVTLDTVSDGTRLGYTVKAAVGGKLGQIGGRMIDASAKQLADQFFAALQAQLEPLAPAETVPTVAPSLAVADAPGAPPAAVPTAAPASVAPIARPVAALPPPAAAPVAGEFSRVLWFLLGVASTGVGVWIGAHLS